MPVFLIQHFLYQQRENKFEGNYFTNVSYVIVWGQWKRVLVWFLLSKEVVPTHVDIQKCFAVFYGTPKSTIIPGMRIHFI